MRLSLSGFARVQPQFGFPAHIEIHMDTYNPRRWKEKVVVVMGATGTGKSRLSIDLATHFNAEVVNSDKMQVYRGLDVVTNKITDEEQRGIPHHLLGVVDPEDEFTALDFRHFASLAIDSISMRGKLPIIAGGSNSYIQALVDDDDLLFRSKYDCCFLWVDVAQKELMSFVSKRVDRMVDAGLAEEVAKIFDPDAEVDYSHGIRRAIGVPEMDRYLRSEDGNARTTLLQEAIDEIKANTCKLALCQLEKIHRLRTIHGWDIHRIDATEVFRKEGAEADVLWERLVAEPSIAFVQEFLYRKKAKDVAPSNGLTTAVTPPPIPAVVAGR